MFSAMIKKLREDTCTFLLNVKIEKPPQMQQRQTVQTQTNEKTQTPAKTSKVVGRNDPCPCGSGKKYKNCCGKQ